MSFKAVKKKPSYKRYLEKKKREGGKPLKEKTWKSLVFGGKGEDATSTKKKAQAVKGYFKKVSSEKDPEKQKSSLKSTLKKIGKFLQTDVKELAKPLAKKFPLVEKITKTLNSDVKDIAKSLPKKFPTIAVIPKALKKTLLGQKLTKREKKGLLIATTAAVGVALGGLGIPAMLTQGAGFHVVRSLGIRVAMGLMKSSVPEEGMMRTGAENRSPEEILMETTLKVLGEYLIEIGNNPEKIEELINKSREGKMNKTAKPSSLKPLKPAPSKSSKPSYEAYLEKKKSLREKPLNRKNWETKVLGAKPVPKNPKISKAKFKKGFENVLKEKDPKVQDENLQRLLSAVSQHFNDPKIKDSKKSANIVINYVNQTNPKNKDLGKNVAMVGTGALLGSVGVILSVGYFAAKIVTPIADDFHDIMGSIKKTLKSVSHVAENADDTTKTLGRHLTNNSADINKTLNRGISNLESKIDPEGKFYDGSYNRLRPSVSVTEEKPTLNSPFGGLTRPSVFTSMPSLPEGLGKEVAEIFPKGVPTGLGERLTEAFPKGITKDFAKEFSKGFPGGLSNENGAKLQILFPKGLPIEITQKLDPATLKSFEKGMGDLGKGVGALGKGVGDLGGGAGALGKGVGDLGKGVGDLGKGVGDFGKGVEKGFGS